MRLPGSIEGFVIERSGWSVTHSFLVDDDDFADTRQAVTKALECRQEDAIHDDDAVASVVRDVRQLLRAQPDVERVHDRAHARHGETRLDMLMVIPAERRDAVATPHARVLERASQLPRSPEQLAVP